MNKLVKTENESVHATGGYVIPAEVADGICKAVLIDMRDYNQSEIDAHIQLGEYLHPEDLVKNRELVYCMTYLIDNYFGGEE